MTATATEKDYDHAMEQAARQSGAMTDAVKTAGFAAEDPKTTRFNVSANYESIRERDGNYRQVSAGYQCSQGFRLAFPLDMKRLGQVLSTIAGSGTQPELHIAFTVKAPGRASSLPGLLFFPRIKIFSLFVTHSLSHSFTVV